MIRKQPSLTILLFIFILAGCNMFNNPLKPFIEESSKREGMPGVGPGDPGGVSSELPGNGQPGNGAGYTPLTAADFLAKADSNSWEMDGHYRLTESVAVPNNWTPIGSDATPFIGSFDGGGYTISGLSPPNVQQDILYRGMFAVIGSGGVVRNLHLVVDIQGGSQVGGIAGRNNGLVERSSVSGTVSGTHFVGGIVGWNDGIVKYSINRATVTAAGNRAGGIVGNNSSIVRDSLNEADVEAGAHAGGVVGWNYASGSVLSCVALNESVTATAESATAHRIVGSGAGTLTNNRAYYNMEVNNTLVTSSPVANSPHGADIEPTTNQHQEAFWVVLMGWWTLHGNTDPWVWNIPPTPTPLPRLPKS